MADENTAMLPLITEDPSFDFEYSALENGWVFHQALLNWKTEQETFHTEAASLNSVTWRHYQEMDAAERRDFNARRERLASRRVVYRTQDIDDLLVTLRRTLKRAETTGNDQQGAVMVIGLPGVGKTTAITECMFSLASTFYKGQYGDGWKAADPRTLLRAYRNAAGDTMHAQSIFALPVRITENATPKAFMIAMLTSIAAATGDEALARLVGRSTMRERERLSQTLVERLRVHGVRMIIVDDIHFVRQNRDGEEIINLLKTILNRSRVVFVIAGVAGARGFKAFEASEASTQAQIGLRSVTVNMEAFKPPTGASESSPADLEEWASVVDALTSRLLLLRQQTDWWLEPETLDYLWRRTQGVFESLDRLLVSAAVEAIGGQEYVDIPLLETVRISDIADETARNRYGIGPLAQASKKKGAGRRAPGRSGRGDEVAERLLRPVALAGGAAIHPQTGFAEE